MKAVRQLHVLTEFGIETAHWTTLYEGYSSLHVLRLSVRELFQKIPKVKSPTLAAVAAVVAAAYIFMLAKSSDSLQLEAVCSVARASQVREHLPVDGFVRLAERQNEAIP